MCEGWASSLPPFLHPLPGWAGRWRYQTQTRIAPRARWVWQGDTAIKQELMRDYVDSFLNKCIVCDK